MVVAAYKLSHSGEGGNHPYDNFGVVDRSHIDEYLVEIRHNGNFDGYFVNSFFPLVVADHDAAFDLQDLECFV